ncbi:MAG: hypothetical protein AAGA50_08170 [Pseudomonadota bacterium]
MMNAVRTATIAGALLLATSSANAVVFNGDFETTSGDVGIVNTIQLSDLAGTGSWDVYTSIPGWTSNSGAGIEVQTNGTLGSIDAHSGQHYVELDSHPSGSSNSSMQQSVALGVGSYELSFYYSPRNDDTASNGIFYEILGGILGQQKVEGPGAGPPVTSVGTWSLVTALFKVTTAGNYDLRFSATGTENTLGGFVDTVSITAVPIPAAGLLLPVGVALLGFAARRRKTG